MLSREEFKEVMPPHMQKHVSDTFIASVNEKIGGDIEIQEAYRNNMIGYTNVLTQGKFKLEQYADAIRFISFKAMGHTNIQSYKRTFPDRCATYMEKGTSKADIEKYVSSYFNSKLVQLLLEQSMIPAYLMNADIFQDAINMQAEIMNDENASFKVRSDAANSLMTHLKAPEAKKIEIDVGIRQTSVIDQLRQQTEKLVNQERMAISSGRATALDIAHSEILEAEVVDRD